jgi:hypothetical protein
MDQFWLISRGGASDVRFRLQPPGPVRVGRSNTNALVLPDVAVSREHALIEWVADGPDRGAWRILDRGSSSGTRVNGVSAGPIKTLAASGIKGFGKLLDFAEQHAPLRRNVSTDEVGNVAAFMLSDLSSGITGEITYVDAGFSIGVPGMGADA